MLRHFGIGPILCLSIMTLIPRFAWGTPQVMAADANYNCLVKDATSSGAYQVKGGNGNTSVLVAQAMNTFKTYGSGNSGIGRALSSIKQFNITDGPASSTDKNAAGFASGNSIAIDSRYFQNKGLATGYLAHEICHFVGRNQTKSKGQAYGAYYKAVGSDSNRCAVSRYSTEKFDSSGARTGESSRAEEFAEACSAYLVAPDKLAASSGPCKSAYDLFHDQVFASAPPSCKGGDSKTYTRDADGSAHEINGPAPSGSLLSSFKLGDGESNFLTSNTTGLPAGTGLFDAFSMFLQELLGGDSGGAAPTDGDAVPERNAPTPGT